MTPGHLQPARPAATAAALLILAIVAVAPASAAAARWSADDMVAAERGGGWTLSRDGRLAAWVRSTVETVDGEEKRVENLWLTRIADAGADPEKASLQLTRGKSRAAAPEFSPDGRHLAFLFDRELPGKGGGKGGDDDEGKRQVWAIPVGGGEAFPVTRLDRSVLAFGWIDADTLVVAAPEARSAWELERKEEKDTATVVEDAEHEPPVRLYRVGLGGDVRRLTTNTDWIDALAVSPDGRHAVVTAQQSLSFTFDSRVPPQARLVDLASGEPRRLFAEPLDDRQLQPYAVAWEPDSSGFYFVDEYTNDPVYRTATVSRLYHHDLASGRAARVDLGWERGLGSGYAVVPGGVVALLADGVYDRLARLRRDGRVWRKSDLGWRGATDHAGQVGDLVASADGSVLLYEHSSPTEPPQSFAARLQGDTLTDVRRLTELNPSFEGKPTGRVDVIRWTGARGDEVEGMLQFPLDWHDGESSPRPLLLDIHGGPASRDRAVWGQSWGAPTLLWRQKGAFVLQVNYHGSSGYGLEWVESIRGHYYELEIPDVEAGVDHVIALGLADPERLGATGWSNGGILTADLITKTGRYKVASIGAADVEWLSDWANVAFGASFDNYYFGGTPWEATEVYLEKSPFLRLTEVTTPTIIYTGTEDTNVPPHQSWSLFRALQQIGKTEARLVVFPGEPHGLRKVAHQRRKIEEDLAWLDRYVFGSEDSAVAAVKDGSLLAGLLQRAGAATGAGGALGREEGGALVPETAPFGRLEVARFEITRAQYAAFDPSFFPGGAPASSERDLPVTGVPFERAGAYAEWLAAKTGTPFRLPTVKEAERLAKQGKGEGPANTLDRWAGYTPNPEDAAAIRRALAEKLGDQLAAQITGRAGAAEAPLLLPVGSLPGAGEPPVFDLAGNAAEWAVAEDGAGKPVGPSADRSSDARGDGGAPAPEYVGFRVVAGEAEPTQDGGQDGAQDGGDAR
jgi:dipeptidyl aminopeptidase/acylaminoacyl peptidase